MGVRIYNLRPPAVCRDVSLETFFRVEMRKDDLTAEGLRAGDVVNIVSQDSGRGGVGIAYLSTETAKSSGNISNIKISPELRKHLDLDLSEKCSITKFEETLPCAKSVSVSERTSSSVHDWPAEKVSYFVTAALTQLDAIIAGLSFTVSPKSGPKRYKKRVFTVNDVQVLEGSSLGGLKLPCYIDEQKTQLDLTGGGHAPQHEEPVHESLTLAPTFSNLPGLDSQLHEISQCVQRVNEQLRGHRSWLWRCLPLLLHGSMGTGKTTIMEQLAGGTGWKKIVRINAQDLSSSASKADAAISKAFAEASSAQPSLVLLDKIDIIAGRNSEPSHNAEIVARELQKAEHLAVQIVAAARRPIDVDEKLLLYFGKQLEMPTPNARTRRQILDHYVSDAVEDSSCLEIIAEKTHAFLAQDLGLLSTEAGDLARRRQNQVIGNEAKHIDGHKAIKITKDDFMEALQHIRPSLMNEVYIEIPRTYWSEIAGSEEVKQRLWDAVELPLKYPEIVSMLNLHSNQGLLLYGPPGCSKTMTAKALATESGLNFIAIKGPELISKYVGESEYKIREIFRKARAASPAVIFFDEIDSIAPNRAGGGHEGLNTVATLLNEMDGIEQVQKVLVLAATNRPASIDPALLRPGRLGTAIFIGPPNYDAVLEILKNQTARMNPTDDLDLPAVALELMAGINSYFSGADVTELCQAAGWIRARELAMGSNVELSKGAGSGLAQRHFLQALKRAKPSLARKDVEAMRVWSLAGGVASDAA